MKIAIASDHGGFALKQNVIMYLEAEGHEVSDLGCYSEESVDYPQFGRSCAQAVARHNADRGIVICGSGIGISIAANKVKGIRCALCTSVEMAKLSRQHNNANMLALGGRLTELADALDIVRAWLTTEFEGGRHERRVAQLDEM